MKLWTKITSFILVLAAIVAIVFTATNANKIDVYNIFNIFNNVKNEPIKISAYPEQLAEVAYPYPQFIPISFTISGLKKNNITHLELTENDLIIDRVNKTGQISSSNGISWDNSYNNYYIISYDRNHWDSDNLTISGKLYNCANCFIGKDYPYIFIFTFKYKQNDGILTPFIHNITVPIK